MYQQKEIMKNQPTINVGMIGSVSNGKSSVTEKITSVKTQKHSSEMKRNITIKLGYANAKIFKCQTCPAPQCYQHQPSSVMDANCNSCDSPMTLEKHISVTDVPGHLSLMTTMLNGTCVMDTTILVESAANDGLAPQTKHHLLATKMIGVNNSIACLNKMDLVKKQKGTEKLLELRKNLIGTMAETSPIIPVAANHGINIDVLCEYICKFIKEPVRNYNATLKMIIIRSFNVNKQEVSLDQLEGGVVGGTITQGVLHKGDKISIHPGLIDKNHDNDKTRWKYKPIKGTVLSINSETNNLDFAIPGGLIGIKLDIDPGLATKDNLVGNIMTNYDNTDAYCVYEIIFVELQLFDDMQIENKEILVINSNACSEKCEVVKTKNTKAELKLLERPICAIKSDYITISKIIANNITVVGRAQILDGLETIRH
ncbi:eukaryotic translation initiation factor 2 gamma subunit [Klosneuvirus KNV1]|uniref:protein-synthesizing GTPase n=1 Tax=Klosneuvirus KNV1 TaxID=1977640 RepID=A0A1V0SLW6_9VIRU|nr:eukaryotic translation initiation factor 2 gamma subunit [Klosneuvirus KNV1]